jgi:hypothetical protein
MSNLKIVIFSFFIILRPSVYAQNIEGKSKPMQLNIVKPYIKDLPPNLYADIQFIDDNANGIIEAEEHARILLTIENKGKGPAQGLEVKVATEKYDPELQIVLPKVIRRIEPNEKREIEIGFKAGFNIKSSEHKIKIDILEHFGFDLDQATMIFNSLQYQQAKLDFIGMELYDQGEGAAPIIADGLLQAGEQVKIKVVVQNIGQNVALNSRYKVESRDPNIYIEEGEGDLGNVKIGEVKEFFIKVTPNKRVKTEKDLPIFLTVNESKLYGNISEKQLPIALQKRIQKPQIVQVKVDIDKLKKQVARVEVNSDKFTYNRSNVKNINSVPIGKMKRPNAIAIIIGIEKYEHLPAAPFAANDAEHMEKYFENTFGISKQNILKFTNEEVRGFFFRKTFDADNGLIANRIVKGETELFVFYSGHGVPDKNGDESYLFPQDGDYQYLNEQGYSLNKFYESLSKMGAKNVTVILDACFSGASRQTNILASANLTGTKAVGIKVKPANIRPWENNPHFRVFASSLDDETSMGFDASESGLFSYYFMIGLQGEADTNKDKKITSEELAEFIRVNVSDLAKKMYGKPQTPVYLGEPGYVLIDNN